MMQKLTHGNVVGKSGTTAAVITSTTTNSKLGNMLLASKSGKTIPKTTGRMLNTTTMAKYDQSPNQHHGG